MGSYCTTEAVWGLVEVISEQKRSIDVLPLLVLNRIPYSQSHENIDMVDIATELAISCRVLEPTMTALFPFQQKKQDEYSCGVCLTTTSQGTPYYTPSVRVEGLTVGELAVALGGAAASPILP